MHYGLAMTSRRLPVRLFLSFLLLNLIFGAAILSAKKKPPLKPVNLNTAGSVELQRVPGIGPATAEKILQMRKSYGAFKSVDDLLAIKGIGKKRLDKMRKYLTVGKPAPKQAAQPTECPGCAKGETPPPKSPPPQKSSAAPAPSAEVEEPNH